MVFSFIIVMIFNACTVQNFTKQYNKRIINIHNISNHVGAFLWVSDTSADISIYELIIFYQDGTCFLKSGIKKRIDTIPLDSNCIITQTMRKQPANWGFYSIKDKKLQIETAMYKKNKCIFEITSDSSFRYFSKIDDVFLQGLADTFHNYTLISLSQKPDSTNVLMKK